jgi:triacylglycerol lipase
MGRSILNGYVDFHLEQFGLTYVPGEDPGDEWLTEAMYIMLNNWEDTAMYDMAPDTLAELNEFIEMDEDTYYFSYAFNSSQRVPLIGTYVPIASTFAVLQPFTLMIGSFSNNRITDYEITEDWYANDGLVSVHSALYPFNAPHKDYESDNIPAGIWNVMPVSTGDHGNAIGIGVSKEQVVSFYVDMIEMIETLPITD